MRRRFARLVLASWLILGSAAAASAAAVSVRAGGGCHGSESAVASESAGTTVVKIDGCLFLPTITRVAVGTAVTFLNSGSGPHDVTGTPNRPDEWKSPLLEPGASYRQAFAKPGVYAYSCSLHPGMAGVVVASPVARHASAVVADGAAPVASGSDPAGSDAGPVALAAGGAGIALGAWAAWVVARRRSAAE